MKAFPTPTFSINNEARVTAVGGEGGMDLRDYFAAMAMQAEIEANEGLSIREGYMTAIAHSSYAMADEMMEARKEWAIQCQKKNYIGGAIGVKDEFEDLLTDGTSRFGLANLVAALKRGTQVSSAPQKDYSIKESIDKRVSKALNEEFKRIFKF